jgi:hypothetical protein
MPTEKKSKAKAKAKSKAVLKEPTYEQFKTSENSCIRISAFKHAETDEDVHINIRKFYRTQKDPQWKPARQGMTLPMELAKKFRIMLKSVCDTAEEGDVAVLPSKEE